MERCGNKVRQSNVTNIVASYRISFMSLDADDAFVSTYLHPAYIYITDRVYSRWETTILKSVRIVHFTPPSLLQCGSKGTGNDEEEAEDNAAYPLTNANKREHRRWFITGRRLEQAAEREEEQEGGGWGEDGEGEDEWTDDTEAEDDGADGAQGEGEAL
jgi:membrane carboxypeptidase/penicillin-binding protein PbpC